MSVSEATELSLEYLKGGNLREAEAWSRKVLALVPDCAEALHILSVVAHKAGKRRLAAELASRAVRAAPDNACYLNTLGMALRATGDLARSAAAISAALQIDPALAAAHSNKGNILSDRGDLNGAIAAFRTALELLPTHAGTHFNLANALRDQGEPEAAMEEYGKAVECDPEYAEAFSNWASVLKDQGMMEAAAKLYKQTVEKWPGNPALHSNLIYALHFLPADEFEELATERSRWNQRHRMQANRIVRAHTNIADPTRRLKIGYVSPDFREHVVGRNVLPLLRCHDPEQVEVVCYSGVLLSDAITERARAFAGVWHDVALLGDDLLVERIRSDEIDILVDLTLHMAGNRLPVFARKPAPVQVSFAGYPGSTGLETIDYRLTDRYLEPPSLLSDFGGERPIYLAHSFWCYEPDGTEPQVSKLPALERGYVTFGCLNNFCKVNESMLELWARVLGQVRGSRLMILAKEGSHGQRTVDRLAQAGVSPECVEFVGFRPRREYLESYHRVDIALDTFPYNGHTTSLDALWMGVPVVSLSGETPVSRAGLSQLSNLGIPELVTQSRDDYVQIAAALAHDMPRVAALRSTLRRRMRASPLTDAPRFARTVEDAYRNMWRRWCATQSGC